MQSKTIMLQRCFILEYFEYIEIFSKHKSSEELKEWDRRLSCVVEVCSYAFHSNLWRDERESMCVIYKSKFTAPQKTHNFPLRRYVIMQNNCYFFENHVQPTSSLCEQHAEFTQLSIPTHAQLQRHRLKFIKNHLQNSYMFRSTTIFRELQCPR